MDLEELKRQNAEARAKEQEAQPDSDELADVQAAEDDPNAEAESAGEAATGEESKAEDVPAWLATEEQTSESGQVPVKAYIATKEKLRGRLQAKDGEIEKLRQEIEQLKGRAAAPPSPAITGQVQPRPMPKLDDFYDKPDPDAAYQAAVNQWLTDNVENQLSQRLTTHQAQQQQQHQNQQINQALDQHYDRAAQIVADGMITADEYQGAETLLRQTVENIAPGNGDSYVNALLARMGEGSEKVVVSLARNAANLNLFRQSLIEDPTGITAAAFLGELKGKFNSVAQRVSRTPRPGSSLKGDGAKDGGTAKRQYQAAHKSGNRQKAFDIKMAAKRQGVDVSQW